MLSGTLVLTAEVFHLEILFFENFLIKLGVREGGSISLTICLVVPDSLTRVPARHSQVRMESHSCCPGVLTPGSSKSKALTCCLPAQHFPPRSLNLTEDNRQVIF